MLRAKNSLVDESSRVQGLGERLFWCFVALIALAFAGLFFTIVLPPVMQMDDLLRGALLDGFVNPTARGYTLDTLFTGVLLLAWIAYERVYKASATAGSPRCWSSFRAWPSASPHTSGSARALALIEGRNQTRLGRRARLADAEGSELDQNPSNYREAFFRCSRNALLTASEVLKTAATSGSRTTTLLACA